MGTQKVTPAEIIRWIEAYCVIPEGRFAGQRVKLAPFQKRIIRGIYGSATRQAIISVGRKNAKTALSAFLLLAHLVGPLARPNSQLYSAAKSRDQAAILFGLAEKIVRMSPELEPHVGIRHSAKQMYCPEVGTLYRALSADATTAHGLSPIFVVHDELGQVIGPRSDLYEALETGSAAHEEPLSIVISTQAPNDGDLLSMLIDDAQKGDDPETKLFLFSAPADADPFSKKAIRAANPAFDHFMNQTETLRLADKARRMPTREAAYRNLVLNQRVSQETPFIPLGIWKQNQCRPDTDAMKAGTVRIGLDLSARNDLTALAVRCGNNAFVEFFAPGMHLLERAQRDRVPYDLWAQQGWLTVSDGASVSYDDIAERLAEICQEYDVEAIYFDRWRIDVLTAAFERMGIELPLEPFGQGYKDMSPALDLFESDLLNLQMNLGDNPILNFCAANTVISADEAGNRKLNKKKSIGRIDGMVALAMTYGLSAPEEKKLAGGVMLAV